MADKVRDVLQKISFLTNDDCPRRIGKMGERRGLAPLCEELLRRRNKRSKDCVKDVRGTVRDQISRGELASEYQQDLADIFKFRVDAREWQMGTLTEFKDYYCRLHPPASAGACPPLEAPDEAGVQYTVSRIRYAPVIEGISVQAFFPQGGKPAAWPFDIEIVCQPAPLPEIGVRVGINRATLHMQWDEQKFPQPHASRARDRDAKLMVSAEALTKKRIEVRVFGDDHAPAWMLSHQDGKPIGIISLDNCSDLHTIEDGLEVFFTLTIYDKDLNAKIASSAIIDDAEPSSIIRPDGQPLGPNKLKILQAIAARSLKDADAPAGTVQLANDGVRFEKRQQP